MIACNRPGCTGVVDDTGYCDAAGHRYLSPLSPTAPETRLDSTTVAGTAGSGGWPGVEHRPDVSLPWIDEPDDSVATEKDLVVQENHRKCGNCGTAVGRRSYGQEARAEGFCPNCAAPYSFVPKLRPGEVLKDRYKVIRPLGHGGLSWAYRGTDTHLHRPVVLKGLITSGNVWEAESIHTERSVLTMLDHPGIVRIYDFVTHVDPDTRDRTDYIVMEYAGGWTLDKLKQQAHAGLRPLPVRDVIGYGLWILDAFDYLHGHGLLYCDLKPDNVIHRENRLKLIDMGAVRAINDRKSPTWGAQGYQVPGTEIRTRGLTVRSDIHTVGRTLAALFKASPGGHSLNPAPPEIESGVQSFRLLLDRAGHEDWHRRFESAARMREQLHGVWREIIALSGDRPDPKPSTLFGNLLALLDGGLGSAPPLRTWTTTAASRDVLVPTPYAEVRPPITSLATNLPEPRPDPGDPAAAFLAQFNTTNPAQLLAAITAFDQPSVEIELLRCRAYLAAGQSTAAEGALNDAAGLVPSVHDWRIAWHRALVALAKCPADSAASRTERVTKAYELFGAVRGWLPGEPAPRLALGLTAEWLAGKAAEAERHFRSVWRTDGTAVSAAFGLARHYLGGGDRDAAVGVLDEVPELSRHYAAARIAAVRIRAGHFDSAGEPGIGDLVDAIRRLAPEHFTGIAAERGRRRLLAFVLPSIQHRVGRKPVEWLDDAPVTVLAADAQRRLLSDQFRALAARQADGEIQHNTLVDLANIVRPSTRW